MNRASLMLAALEGNHWRSRLDIFEHAGRFFLTNNAASELRALGYDVEERRFQGNYEYRLLSPTAPAEEPDGLSLLPRGEPPKTVVESGTPSSLSTSSAGQLSLEGVAA